MDFGKVEYIVYEPKYDGGSDVLRLKLTLIGQDDDKTLKEKGLAELRRKRILRLTMEAGEQGGQLGYDDLCGLLLTSLATIKRDVSLLEKRGFPVPLKGRRKNGKGDKAA